jgi:hypothetical protein
MSHAAWIGVLCALAILLLFALKPILMWLASYIHWRRHERAARAHRGDGNGTE